MKCEKKEDKEKRRRERKKEDIKIFRLNIDKI